MDEQTKSLLLATFIAGVILLFGGLAVFFNRQTASPTDTTTNSPTPTITVTPTPESKAVIGETLTFTLVPQNDSNQIGTVILQEVGGQVQVTINSVNVTPDIQPAHIHMGSCPTPGSVVFPLEDLINGASVTLLNTTLADLKSKDSLSINIHKSAEESSVYYACTDLTF